MAKELHELSGKVLLRVAGFWGLGVWGLGFRARV